MENKSDNSSTSVKEPSPSGSNNKIWLIGIIVVAIIGLIGVLFNTIYSTQIPLRATKSAEETQTIIVTKITATSVNREKVIDNFDSQEFTNLWLPPDNPQIIKIENGKLIFRVSREVSTNGEDATLILAPSDYPIREISLTMTMISYARVGEGGVGARAFMSNGPDHHISLTHDSQNAAVEFGVCLQEKCSGNYEEYQHASSYHVQENDSLDMKIVWDGFEVALYVDNIKRDSSPAEGTPITGFELTLFSNSGGAFELAVDDIAITYVVP